jgi:hypothetical protein
MRALTQQLPLPFHTLAALPARPALPRAPHGLRAAAPAPAGAREPHLPPASIRSVSP